MSSSAASSGSTATQTVYALTTTFTPAAPTCTQSFWTLLGPSKSYNIYLNYPVPVPHSTSSACYPSQFMSSYLAQQAVITPLPAIQPLICPVGYSSMSVANAPNGYLACCPLSMGLALSSPTQSGRPAFGGTCYKAITSITITAYGDQSVTATSVWQTPEAIGAQAYAFPIEGYAYVTGSASSASATSQSSSATTTSTESLQSLSQIMSTSSSSGSAGAASATSVVSASKSSDNHAGAIAGGVVGGLAVLALLAVLIFFLLRRKRTKPDAITTWSEDTAAIMTEEYKGPYPGMGYGSMYRSSEMASQSDVTSAGRVHEMTGSTVKRKPLVAKAELPADTYHPPSMGGTSTISPESHT